MAKYRFLEKGFAIVDPNFPPRLVEADEVVEVSDDIYPGPYMQPADEAAVKRFRQCLDKEGRYKPAPMRNMAEDPLAAFATFDTTKLMEGANAGR